VRRTGGFKPASATNLLLAAAASRFNSIGFSCCSFFFSLSRGSIDTDGLRGALAGVFQLCSFVLAVPVLVRSVTCYETCCFVHLLEGSFSCVGFDRFDALPAERSPVLGFFLADCPYFFSHR
jgi:hypothetical protein